MLEFVENDYIYTKIGEVPQKITHFVRGQTPIDSMDIGLETTIKNWLEEHNITKYQINPDSTINVFELVDLSGKGKIPEFISFNLIRSGFYCGDNKLTSLKGVPRHITGSFKCDNNLLKSLKEGPEVVESFYVASFNKLTSLEGLPKKSYTLAIDNNQLTSFKGCPEIITGDFYCNNNNFKNLDYFPKTIFGTLYISYTEEFKKRHDIDDPHISQIFMHEIQKICVVKDLIKII